jgi:hypothetical protein
LTKSTTTNGPAKAKPAVPVRAEPPDARERAAIDLAHARQNARLPRFATRLEVGSDGNAANIGPLHDDHQGWQARLQDIFGTCGKDFALAQLYHVLGASRSAGQLDAIKANALLAIVEAAQPANEVEAILAVQMAVTHELAMQALSRAQRVDQINQYESAAGMAVKLMRTFTAQIEAMAKLQRGGEQVVRVVHVHAGAQAVVGNVVAGGSAGGGGRDEFGNQPHAKGELPAPGTQPLPSLRRPHQAGERVSLTRCEGESPMSDARRRAR